MAAVFFFFLFASALFNDSGGIGASPAAVAVGRGLLLVFVFEDFFVDFSSFVTGTTTPKLESYPASPASSNVLASEVNPPLEGDEDEEDEDEDDDDLEAFPSLSFS